MACCHTVITFEDYIPVFLMFILNTLGIFTFPIMAYLIVEGYHKTSNIKKYIFRLFFFGLLSSFPSYLLNGRLSVMFTLLYGLISLFLWNYTTNKVLFWLCFSGMIILSIFSDWSIIGVPLIFMYGTIKGEKRRIILSTVIILIIGLVIVGILAILRYGWSKQLALDSVQMLAGIFVIPLLLSYNSKRGYSRPSLKYLFYIFYPAHFLILYGLKWLIEK